MHAPPEKEHSRERRIRASNEVPRLAQTLAGIGPGPHAYPATAHTILVRQDMSEQFGGQWALDPFEEAHVEPQPDGAQTFDPVDPPPEAYESRHRVRARLFAAGLVTLGLCGALVGYAWDDSDRKSVV